MSGNQYRHPLITKFHERLLLIIIVLVVIYVGLSYALDYLFEFNLDAYLNELFSSD